jgi:hypothetical protein
MAVFKTQRRDADDPKQAHPSRPAWQERVGTKIT